MAIKPKRLALKTSFRGSRELQRELRRLGREAPKILARALFKEGERIMAASKLLVPVDLGPLRASGHVQLPEIRGARVKVLLGYGGAATPYAVVIHEGRKAGSKMPPPDALEDWAARHGIPTDPGTLFGLARSIGEEGTEATKYLEKPFNEAIIGMEGRLAKTARAAFEKKKRRPGRKT